MLNAHKLKHIAIAREALGMSLMLHRIADGKVVDSDKEAIRVAAEELQSNRRSSVRMPLFSSAAGLAITIRAVRDHLNSSEALPSVKLLAQRLSELGTIIRTDSITNKARKDARNLSFVFRSIHDLAEEVAAEGSKTSSTCFLVT